MTDMITQSAKILKKNYSQLQKLKSYKVTLVKRPG